MKLERFKEKNNKRKFIILFTVCCVFLLAGVFLYTSFAIFTEDKQFNVINGKYQDPGDLYFAVYVDGEITNTIPSKDSGYTLDETQSSCTNGAKITWDDDSWSAFINLSNYSAGNMSRTKCTMYFKVDYPIATDYIISLADSSSELVYDETVDNNLRYIGANPNNYLAFNGELWRIIGVMNNIDDGTGKKETRLKIIRDESIGQYIWNTDFNNDWSQASLKAELNTTYLNSIQSSYQEMIGNAVWNLGGTTNSTSSSNGLASHWYGYERGTEVYSGHATTWTGQIGLMYPSDYGYATSGGSIGRNTCLATELYDWDSVSDCYNNDWLYNGDYQWTLTPFSRYQDTVFMVLQDNVDYADPTSFSYTFPVVYLASNVKITGGTGEESNPFILSL